MKEFLPDGMDFDETREYRDRILEERKEEVKKRVHRRNRRIKNKLFFVYILYTQNSFQFINYLDAI
jgi:hypothetical protein